MVNVLCNVNRFSLGRKMSKLKPIVKSNGVFSDFKGFTELTDSLEPEVLSSLLNNYLNEMSKIALKYGGMTDKFVVYAILYFFGDPETKGKKEDAKACVLMALEMRKRMHSSFFIFSQLSPK